MQRLVDQSLLPSSAGNVIIKVHLSIEALST